MKNRFPIYLNLIVIVSIDILLLGASWYTAFLLRYNFDLPQDSSVMVVRLLPVVILIKIIAFYFFNVYRGMWRYTSLIDLFNIIKASVLSTLVIITLIIFSHSFTGFARAILVIDGVVTILFISGSRVCLRLYFEMMSEDVRTSRLNTSACGPGKSSTKN